MSVEKPKSSPPAAGKAWASQTGVSAECRLGWRGSDLGVPSLPLPLNDQEGFCPWTPPLKTLSPSSPSYLFSSGAV